MRSRRRWRRGRRRCCGSRRMLRTILVFLAGALVGANLVYFAMTRERGATAAAALQAPVATPAARGGPVDADVEPSPAASRTPTATMPAEPVDALPATATP